MSRASSCFRWMALGLLAPWLVMGCGSDSEAPSPPGTSDSTDAGTLTDGGTSTDAGTNTGSDPQFIEDMLAAHNVVRAGATPQPSPALPALAWDTAAEKKAALWVARCSFEHNPNRGDAGENIAAATPGYWQTRDVVKDWAAEAKNYDYANNTCASGKECGHYTQVVWRNTTRVGCATKVCTEHSPFGAQFPTWQFWVCDYTPPGNYVGQRPY